MMMLLKSKRSQKKLIEGKTWKLECGLEFNESEIFFMEPA